MRQDDSWACLGNRLLTSYSATSSENGHFLAASEATKSDERGSNRSEIESMVGCSCSMSMRSVY